MSLLHCPFGASAAVSTSACCAVFAAVSLAALPAAAQPAAAALDAVVITATRAPQRVDQALAEVTVIDRADIEAATGRTLPELLARAGGVQFWSNGGLGKVSSVSLRGLESRHTLLLVDGVRVGSATTGTPGWDNLPLDAIERVEIVRGPMSGLYGSGAVGGVVQVFTRRGTQGFLPDARLAVGSRGHAELAAGLRMGSGPVDGTVRVQQIRTNGFSTTNAGAPFGNFNPDDDGFRQSSVNASLGLALGTWRAETMLLQSRGDTRFDDGPAADSLARLTTELAAVSLAGPVAGSWRSAVKASRARDGFDTVRTASRFTATGVIGTVSQQLSWDNTVTTPIGRGVWVLDHTRQTVEKPGTAYAVSQRSITGAAVGLDGRSGVHNWQANVRRDRNSQYGRQNSGALGYGLLLMPGVQAAASLGRAFVAPSFNDLYFPGYSNPELRPERSESRELSLKLGEGAVTGRVAYFDTRISNYIAFGATGPTNLGRAQVEGVSLSMDAVLGPWTLVASVESLDPLNATAGDPNLGRTLPRRVRESARLLADWRRGPYSAAATLHANGERPDNASNTVVLGGYTTLDLRADWAVARDWRVGLALNNAGNKRYETVQGYNQPGREAFVTLRYGAR